MRIVALAALAGALSCRHLPEPVDDAVVGVSCPPCEQASTVYLLGELNACEAREQALLEPPDPVIVEKVKTRTVTKECPAPAPRKAPSVRTVEIAGHVCIAPEDQASFALRLAACEGP
jgi:hypothetical protein